MLIIFSLINRIKTYCFTDNDFIYNVEECPICLSEFTSPVRIDCGHAYCLSCIVTYFKTNNFRWKCVCPLCKILVKNVIILHVIIIFYVQSSSNQLYYFFRIMLVKNYKVDIDCTKKNV